MSFYVFFVFSGIKIKKYRYCYFSLNFNYGLMHSVGGPSAPRAAAPRGGLAAAEASTAVVAKAAGCTSRLTAAALGALVPPNQPSRQGCLGRVCRRPGDNTLQPLPVHIKEYSRMY